SSPQMIREYALAHAAPAEGNLFKTLLARVDSCDDLGCSPSVGGGTPPQSTSFHYESVHREMAAAEPWILPELDVLPLQATLNAGVNGQGGIGANVAAIGQQRGAVGISGSVNGNIGAGQTVSMFMDINGDGLP